MSTNEILLRLAAIKAVRDVLTKVEKDAKDELLGEVRGRMGATSATLEDGTEAATVSVSLGKAATLYVADERAFLKWVRENRPTAIVESVRSSDQASILEEAKSTGEIPDGVELGNPGERYVTVRQSADQRTATVAAWRRGELPLPSLQLEAPQ